ncbi:TadE-like protein [Thalassoglobus neptunius]|uniref:TadE-like protein n=1 Tax=Thalassoglobus neptunius TaxID=1938619 RepID=A0A5C5VZR5_9PLAN|nr:TadE/TadG family type IV pilus assembly protein [Thalassoglobus neptunius]TWT43597.1 TadE-like protein [Thalassoglobus neptunius]
MRRQHRISNQKKSRLGAAIVETAVMMPILLSVTFGVIEFGRAFMVSNLITNAAREGSRQAIIKGVSTADVKTAVIDQVRNTVGATLTTNQVTVTITPYTGNPNPNNECLNASTRDLIVVAVSVPYTDVGYFFRYLTSVDLKAKAAMRHE